MDYPSYLEQPQVYLYSDFMEPYNLDTIGSLSEFQEKDKGFTLMLV